MTEPIVETTVDEAASDEQEVKPDTEVESTETGETTEGKGEGQEKGKAETTDGEESEFDTEFLTLDGKTKVPVDEIMERLVVDLHTPKGVKTIEGLDSLKELAQKGLAATQMFQEAAAIRKENEQLKANRESDAQDMAREMLKELLDGSNGTNKAGAGDSAVKKLFELQDQKLRKIEQERLAEKQEREQREVSGRNAAIAEKAILDIVHPARENEIFKVDGKFDNARFEKFAKSVVNSATEEAKRQAIETGRKEDWNEYELRTFLNRALQGELKFWGGLVNRTASAKVAAMKAGTKAPAVAPGKSGSSRPAPKNSGSLDDALDAITDKITRS